MNTTARTDPSTAAADEAAQALRLAVLMRQAPLEFARVVFGLNDRASGRLGTAVAADVARAARHGVPVTRERAEQRARAYLPIALQPHCPRCWIFDGSKNLLQYRSPEADRPEVAACKACGAEYASMLD